MHQNQKIRRGRRLLIKEEGAVEEDLGVEEEAGVVSEEAGAAEVVEGDFRRIENWAGKSVIRLADYVDYGPSQSRRTIVLHDIVVRLILSVAKAKALRVIANSLMPGYSRHSAGRCVTNTCNIFNVEVNHQTLY